MNRIPVFVFALIFMSACSEQCDQAVQADQGWVRKPLPGRTMTAAYMDLSTCGDQLEVAGFRSPQYERAELHQTVVTDGVSAMRKVPSLILSKGKPVSLQPGGMHLMLMRPTENFDEGSPVEIVVILADGRELAFSLPLASGPPPSQ